jgi:amidase
MDEIAPSRREFLIHGGVCAAATWAGGPLAATPAAPPASEWDFLTARELAAALRARRISASELLQQTVARVEAVDRRINAVVVRDFERAREAAKAADVALARGDEGALLGVPMTVKESFNVAGLPTTWGYAQFKNFKPQQDALVVSRLKKAGAVIFGKTNVPLALSDWQSYNAVYGTTNNPWDVTRTPGGSSGGSAAALAAGMGALSIGSDMGGSLRVPAHYCGVCAHKPSLGLLPTRGQTPPDEPPLPYDNGLAVVGPMARSAADLMLALDVVAGPDEEQAGVGYRLALPAPRHAELKGFRALLLDAHPLGPTAKEMKDALARLAGRLTKAGVKLARDAPEPPNPAQSARLFMRLLSAARGETLPARDYAKLQSEARGLSPENSSLAAERARGAVISHRDWAAADRERAELRQRWRALFRDWDVVLCPPAPCTAFRHDHSEPIESRRLEIDGHPYSYLDSLLLWAELATTPGLPATVVPLERSASGLPIGVQIIGPYLEDRTTIAFAALLEREFGGFEPPHV